MPRARYAIYFTPAPGSAWSEFGAQWLGSHPRIAARPPAGVAAERFRALTAAPRRYGFHATLKAPFALREGETRDSLLEAVGRLAASRRPARVPPLRVRWLDGFLALAPDEPSFRLRALGAACVVRLDSLRAPLSDAERQRRLRARLDERQRELLERWGYPQVLDRWRFHMTLTDVVERGDGSLRAALAAAAWARLPGEPAIVDALSVLIEREPGARFELLERLPLRGAGRLVYVVGASGVGKDSLLAWAKRRLPPEAPLRFARRTISRPFDRGASDAEDARLVDRGTWERMRAEDAFALHWQANGSAYGIDRSIERELAAGHGVVVNGSREHLPEALRRFPSLEVIHVVASDEAIRTRLAGRARETAAQIERRLDRRIAPAAPPEVPFLEIPNDGPLEAAGSRLLDALLDA